MKSFNQFLVDLNDGSTHAGLTGDSFLPAALVEQAVPTGKQPLQVAQQESKQEQSNGRHDEIRHDHHGDISLDSGAINSAAGKQDLSLTYTTGHCENHKQKGGCQLHNLQCGWPNCDRKPTGPTPIPQPAVPQEPVAYCVYFPTEQRQEFCRELDDLCDDLTNLEHEITPLYAAPQPQRPRLTDDEIQELAMANVGVVHKLMCGQQITVREFRSGLNEFARLVERKVRCEA